MQYNAANKSLTELDEGFLFVTAHFNNMRTLKFKSHCCVFPCTIISITITNLESQKHKKIAHQKLSPFELIH